MLPLSALMALTSVLFGLYVATWVGNIAAGSSIVVVSTLQFLVVLALAPRYGMIADWWRKRNLVPQQLVEDVLGCFRKQMNSPRDAADLYQEVARPADQISRAIRSLKRRDWLEVVGQQLKLTEQGKREAKRLLRAHRLWETYLQHVGTPVDELHDHAHQLEHVHDEATVDYLDDKLGHPLTDPHGAEIPEDFEHLVEGNEVKASLLREGHRAVVVGLAPLAQSTPLRSGMIVVAGARSRDGKLWRLRLPDGQEVALDHEMADAVTVRFDNTRPQQGLS